MTATATVMMILICGLVWGGFAFLLTRAVRREGRKQTRSHAAGERAERIYLTGFMGAGKSEVGRALAARLGYRFLDLDHEIEAAAGAGVGEIFSRRGEAAFRRLESRALAATAEAGRVVVATGGGAVVAAANRDLVRRLGLSVWIDPDFDTILGRLDAAGRHRRPLFADEDQARDLYRRRRDAYRQADFRIAVDDQATADEVAARIADLCGEKLCDT